ncbi:hypothetical protein CKO28_00830 [Rhodovibrio sodomensis]|uniref:DUF7007 domain-containing protein n=1 Tax=Rhodovibrio sodomensis TaxID=1088 RepID=A0ABS1D841_9PROT|nr:hypothetical protein [Rhodovibrio sodomensis]MBK1666586.1 hypothetical protein [Rhodovibrio sodomensis]
MLDRNSDKELRLRGEFEPVPPRQTPWGAAEHVERIARGIWHVSTPSHGGIWLSAERTAALPSPELVGRTTPDGGSWFEEDVEFAIPALVFLDAWRAHAEATGRDPDQETAFPRQVLGHFRPQALAMIDAAQEATG